jgi:protein-tyrosine kinase
MSRIHEALKKAEEQRAASQGGAVESLATSEVAAVMPTPDFSPAAAHPPTGAAAGRPTLDRSVSLDTLLERCPANNWQPDLKTMLFFGSEEQGYGKEQFRTLRSRLYQLRERQPLKKLLITSALPKEGKSFVAANLAQVVARQKGHRALLIDADLRSARLHTALGTSSAPGLADYLLGEADEFSVMQRGQMENLFFIPQGRGISNPAELVANGRLANLLKRVESLFEWIIIDTPPAVPVSDASLMANCCDGVLMVVRSDATPFDIARKARQEFSDKHLVGVVLNGIDTTSSPYTEYYYAAYTQPNGNGETKG